jgi:hypothetical protein
VYIKKKGPQMFTKSEEKCEYINEGGYCMFYIYIFIQHLLSIAKLTTLEIMDIFNNSYSKDMLFFPKKDNIEPKSKEIIDSIIVWKP